MATFNLCSNLFESILISKFMNIFVSEHLLFVKHLWYRSSFLNLHQMTQCLVVLFILMHVLDLLFSSPERLGSQGELIGWP